MSSAFPFSFNTDELKTPAVLIIRVIHLILEAVITGILSQMSEHFCGLNSKMMPLYLIAVGYLIVSAVILVSSVLMRNGSTPVSQTTFVLCALRFYATGAYQKSLGQHLCLNMSQQTVSKCISQVTNAMNELMLENYVQFPEEREYVNLQAKFYSRYKIPGVIGAVDCTHIAIEAPSKFDEVYPEPYYVNRKMYHSINTQLICDADLRILNVNSRYPGRTHDAFIWRSSNVRSCLEDEFLHFGPEPSGWLLGDSGYPLEPWLMTPVSNPQTAAERAYNTAHSSARSVVERCNGVLKSRFRCLSRYRTLKYKPTAASKIVNACVVLHNMCVDERTHMLQEQAFEEDGLIAPQRERMEAHFSQREPERKDAERIREKLISEAFS